jgi:hypothetical protein
VADHNLVGVDPKFVNISNSLGADGIPFTSDDGLRLQNNSPAIDAGTYVGLPYLGNAPDIGAYESNYTQSCNRNTPADLNCDLCVSNNEFTDYLTSWIAGRVNSTSFFDAASKWVVGGC